MKRILGVMILMLVFVGMLTGCGLTVPRPQIKSGEFAFSVTYELSGESKTISGVYVCEYNGTDWALDGGAHRDWKGSIKGGTEDTQIEIGSTEDGGTIYLCLHLDPNYFMGENGSDVSQPSLMIRYPEDELGGVNIIQDADEIESTYGAKIICYQYDEPIENTFGLFK